MVNIADIVKQVTAMFPNLPNQIKAAKLNKTPEELVRSTLKVAGMGSLSLGATGFFLLSKSSGILVTLPIFPISFLVIFFVFINSPMAQISKRRRELDREVLFAGRYLQIKLHSGKPLLNALIEASRSYGVAGKYYKEIVDDINMGTPIEAALNNAMIYSPSDRFKKILFQINNALKIGVNIADSLDGVLNEIGKEQLIDLQKYSKKLNSMSLFYMMGAIVLPSLGSAMLAVIGSLIGFLSDPTTALMLFGGVCLFLVIIQIFFILLFKNVRMTVNI